jgi:flagellar motility protein MotE (MotC chaperone)
VLDLICLALTLAAAEGPTPPTPPSVKEPEAPAAEAPARPVADRKSEDRKGDAKKGEDKKGDDKKAEAKKSDDKKSDAKKGEAKKSDDKKAAPEKDRAAEASKPAGEKPEESAEDKPAPRAKAAHKPKGLASTPPSLTSNALRGEMRQSGGAVEGPRPTERARLEQLASDITRAREALRADTARLEQMLKSRGESGGMPVGDPLAEGGPAAPPLSEKDLQKEQLDSVSKALKGMKPEQAAAIVARLDRLLAAEILRRMRPADAGAVMGQLKPEVAAELATTIATKKPGSPAREGKSP